MSEKIEKYSFYLNNNIPLIEAGFYISGGRWYYEATTQKGTITVITATAKDYFIERIDTTRRGLYEFAELYKKGIIYCVKTVRERRSLREITKSEYDLILKLRKESKKEGTD